MAFFVSALASGSNGNCYYISNDKEAILIDAGISCRETERRMKRLGLSMAKVKAVFISHEHSDHIRGLPTLVKKYQLPVYLTPPMRQFGGLYLEDRFVRSFSAYNPVRFGDLSITAFPKLHDASDPYSFIVTYNDLRVGVFTDIGIPCEHVIRHFSQCHAAFLEANYDDEMLENGNYPYHLKKRIRGGKGHLSNKQALDLFKKYKSPYLSHLFLSHLSKNNNCPQLVQDLFLKHADNTKIIVASRYEETSLFQIAGVPLPASNLHFLPEGERQLSFSF